MKKKQYEKPSLELVVLKQQQQLLVSSPGQADVQDYTWHDNIPEE